AYARAAVVVRVEDFGRAFVEPAVLHFGRSEPLRGRRRYRRCHGRRRRGTQPSDQHADERADQCPESEGHPESHRGTNLVHTGATRARGRTPTGVTGLTPPAWLPPPGVDSTLSSRFVGPPWW